MVYFYEKKYIKWNIYEWKYNAFSGSGSIKQ